MTENAASAFDRLAPTYDADFTHTRIGAHLRARVHAHLARLFRPGDLVLELGCGTGEDAAWLAGRGVAVTATDSSPAMLDAARAKLAHSTGAPVRVAALDLAALPAHGFPGPFAGVYSSFGVVNCLADWQPLARWLAARIGPGGRALFGVIAPYPLWEAAWHTLHGRPRTGFRRWGGSAVFALADAPPLRITYPLPGRFARAFAPYFRPVWAEPLGLLLPPTDVYAALERRPRTCSALLWLDERVGRARVCAAFADHYVIALERTGAT
jgi:SAM-dependent methyltransferase